MDKTAVKTDKAPQAIGPYSQGIEIKDLVFTSGQIPALADGQIACGGIKEQTAQCLKNLAEVLRAAGCTLENVIKTTVFIKDMNSFADMNAVYSEYFQPPYPARSCVEAARLPKDVLVEIEAIAVKSADKGAGI